MGDFWIYLLVFWGGGCVGFMLFAALQVSRETNRREPLTLGSTPLGINTETKF